MASIPTNELNNLFTTYSTKVGNRWDGKETARGCSRKLSLGLDLRFDLGVGLRLGFGLGFRQVLGLGFRLGVPFDIGEWQVSRGIKHTRRALATLAGHLRPCLW